MKKKLIALFCILFLVVGCTSAPKADPSVVGDWLGNRIYSEDPDRPDGNIYYIYDEEGNYTSARVTKDNIAVTGNYKVYFGDEAYEVLTEVKNPARWQNALVDTILELDHGFKMEDLVAFELSNLVYYDSNGDAITENEFGYTPDTNELHLAFITEDENQLYFASRGVHVDVNDEYYFLILNRE